MTDKKTEHLEMLAKWIEARLDATTHLDKTACGLIANDLVANLPQPFNAAPDLLAFARKWVDFRNGVLEPDGGDIDLKELWFMATQAIAKAETS